MAMKKGRLTTEEKLYLDNHKDVEIEKLCKKLKRSKDAIEGYLDLTKEPEPEPTKRESYIKNLFAKKEDRGVVVMTEAASMYMDERKKQHKNKLDQSFIHKFDNNK